MRVLVVSTYELGHQPLQVANAAGALRREGHAVRCVDLAVEQWDPSAVDDVDALAVSVPMHTATVLAADVAASAAARRPALPRCAFGLYAPSAVPSFDRAIAGEFEDALVSWVGSLGAGLTVHRGRSASGLPARDLLPPLDRYVHLDRHGALHVVGSVAASHGCASRCRHCPVPVVYDGRIRIVAEEAVLADVAQLVEQGARHITFADPDFLNGVHHSMRVVHALHERFPDVTFDVTTKVELILRNRDRWVELAALGCLFVTTAMECVDDRILAILDKGHTAVDAAEAVGVLRAAGIEPRPSLLPFTPWTTLDGLVALVDFVVDHDLVPNVEPVHWTIRLLLPEGSLLLSRPELAPHLGAYDPVRLGWTWQAADRRVDDLQQDLAALVERAIDDRTPTAATFRAVAGAIRTAAGLDPDIGIVDVDDTRPRLTESWFCCAEPTTTQRSLSL